MPTFTSATLDRFLQPGEEANKKTNMPSTILDDKKTRTTHSSSDSSSFSFPPTPSIVNHKRHDTPSFTNFFSQGNDGTQNGRRSANGKDAVLMAPIFSPCNDVVKTYENVNGFRDSSRMFVPSHSSTTSTSDVDGFQEDFYDPRDSLSVASSADAAEDNLGTFKLHTPTAEFYDAYEELSEGGSQSSLRDLEAELRERRLSWLMEIEGRKQAEEALDTMKRQWERLAQKLYLEGLTLPSASAISTVDGMLEPDPVEGLCQQIRLARVVSTSVGMGAAKAEAEMEFESRIESKNFEIARLLRRLNYYETVNHEMSLINQEATDMARRLTQRRKRRQRWIWSAAGVSVVLGSVALAWFLHPKASGSPPTHSCHAPEGNSTTNRPPN